MTDSDWVVIADEAPSVESLTAYDEAHMAIYLRLLDANAEGASEQDMARLILGIDPDKDLGRALRAVASHLRRARWMSERGYQRL